jgi:hypothetical protein
LFLVGDSRRVLGVFGRGSNRGTTFAVVVGVRRVCFERRTLMEETSVVTRNDVNTARSSREHFFVVFVEGIFKWNFFFFKEEI